MSLFYVFRNFHESTLIIHEYKSNRQINCYRLHIRIINNIHTNTLKLNNFPYRSKRRLHMTKFTQSLI